MTNEVQVGRGRTRAASPPGAALLAALLFGALIAVCATRGVSTSTAWAQDKASGGLNPAEQRVEMIKLLRSIDQRLEKLVENTKK